MNGSSDESILFIVTFLVGYGIIFIAADQLIDNLCDIAKLFNVSPFLIGILIIGIDPEECISSIIAATQNLPGIAIGNIIGNSIIALTLCFAIPLLFLSNKHLQLLCNLNKNTYKNLIHEIAPITSVTIMNTITAQSITNPSIERSTHSSINTRQMFIEEKSDSLQMETSNLFKHTETNPNMMDSSGSYVKKPTKKRKILSAKAKQFQNANRNKVPIFYYLLLILSTIVIACNGIPGMHKYKYNLLITGSINLTGFILYLFLNLNKYFRDKSMHIVIDESKSSTTITMRTGINDSSINDSTMTESSFDDETQLEKHKKIKKIFLSIFWLGCVSGGGYLLVYSAKQLIDRVEWLDQELFGYLIISFVTNIEEITLIIKAVHKNQFHIGLGGMIGKLYFNINLSYGVCSWLLLNMEWTELDTANSIILIVTMLYLCSILCSFHFKRYHGVFLMLIFIGFYFVTIVDVEINIYH